MIDSYDFGKITIDGKIYTSDVIIYPDHITGNWWRKVGHQLCVEDVREAIQAKPEMLVVGTGYSGLMRVLSETESYLESLGVKLIAADTRQACKTYNEVCQSQKVVAALHLTC